MKTKRILLVGIAFISITLGLTALRNDDKSFEISKQLNIYATLFRDVNMFYVDEVNPGDLVTTGIKAMLKSPRAVRETFAASIYCLLSGIRNGRCKTDDYRRICRYRFRHQ